MFVSIVNKKISKDESKLYDFRDKKLSKPIIFSDCEFDTDVLFQYSNIDSRILFQRCVFNGKLIFGDKNESYHAFVSQNVECNDCTFNDKVLLDGLICDGNIFFNDCRFLYKSVDIEDYGLSISRSKVENSIQLKNCQLSCGIDLSNSSISHNGCVFEDVIIKSKKGELKFTSCHVGKELSFTNCGIVVDRIMMDQLGVDDITGSVKFVGGNKLLERIKLNEDDLMLIKNPDRRNNYILKFPILEEHGGFRDFLVMRENITTLKTGNGYLCFKKTKHENNFYYDVFTWSFINVNRDFFLSNGDFGNTFFIENAEVHCAIFDAQESKCGSFTIDNAIVETSVWDLRSMHISNCFNINHTLCQFFDQKLDMTKLFKKDKFAHLQICSTEIGHNFDFNDIDFEIADMNGMPFRDKNGNLEKSAKSIYLDTDHMKVGGSITIENISVFKKSHLIDINNESVELSHILNVNLEATNTETCVLNFTNENWCNLYLEDFKFSNILINGSLPGKTELVAMIPKELSFLSGKKYDKIISGAKQGCNIQTGMISFMRECQDKLISTKDGYDEANEIWRLRNQLRLYQQYKNKKFKYNVYKTWNKFTDFGLSSTTIIFVVLGVFVLYLGLNVLVLSLYTHYDVSGDKMSVVGQSLIQYIPTIDFGDELKIINFEQGLPNGYKYLVIAARITGFILISILVASLGGLWKGRNK